MARANAVQAPSFSAFRNLASKSWNDSFGRGMGPSQELCPHSTAQRKRRGLSPDNVTNFTLYASVTETDAITSIMNNIFWSLTLSEERRLRVFENSLLKKIFGPTMDEIKRPEE